MSGELPPSSLPGYTQAGVEEKGNLLPEFFCYGYRSVADVSLAVFIGGVEQALPHFVGCEGICPQLTTLIGGMENSASRWRLLIESGCRTGV